jgi:hypothetical protein
MPNMVFLALGKEGVQIRKSRISGEAFGFYTRSGGRAFRVWRAAKIEGGVKC